MSGHVGHVPCHQPFSRACWHQGRKPAVTLEHAAIPEQNLVNFANAPRVSQGVSMIVNVCLQKTLRLHNFDNMTPLDSPGTKGYQRHLGQHGNG